MDIEALANAKNFVLRLTPAGGVLELEHNSELRVPPQVFDALLEQFAALAGISAHPKRGRAEGLILRRESLHPLVLEGQGDERCLRVRRLTPEEYRAELDRELQLAAADSDQSRLAYALQRRGVLACIQGQPELAQRNFEDAVDCICHGPRDHEQLGLHLHWLASVFAQRGEYALACALFERAANERALGGPDGLIDGTDVGSSLRGVADCLSVLAEPVRAVDYYQRALAQLARGDVNGQIDHEQMGSCLDAIGCRCWHRGDLDASSVWFARAVAQHAQGDAHGCIDYESSGRSLHAFADCLCQRERYGDALPCYERAVAALERGAVADEVLIAARRARAQCLERLSVIAG